ncbi:MAG TPA: hypothetical protein VIP11_21665 [Gemmatimonadaceae bacterium]
MSLRGSLEHRLEVKALIRRAAERILFGAFFLTVGCMRWNGVPLDSGLRGPTILRLHLRDGSTVTVREAVVRGDSIIGVRAGNAAARSRIAVALAQVERAGVGETDNRRTAGLVFGLLVVVWLASSLLLLLALANEGT